MTIKEAYLFGRERLAASGVQEAAIQAEMLLRFVLHAGRAQLYTQWDGPMPEPSWTRYRSLIEERGGGRPVHYIIGEREFMGLRFKVDERVLIPRPETEVLVEQAARWIREHRAQAVVDVGTGSGTIAVTLTHLFPQLTVYATDLFAGALEVARENARAHDVADHITFLQGDLLSALPHDLRGRVDVVVSNPPYVPSDQAYLLSRDVREFEPHAAIFVDGDGSEMHRRLIGTAPEWLRPGGLLAMEVGAGQAPAIADVVASDGRYTQVSIFPDLIGIERVVAGTRAREAEGDPPAGRKE